MLGYGTLVAANLVRRLKPAAVVGFGGYPTLPPLLAARLLGVPGIIHDANAVLGRANRFLSRRVNAIATSLPGVLDRDPDLAGKTTTVGTPMRPAILAAAAVPFASPEPNGPLRLLVVGGSQGARVMSDIVPSAVERLEPALWRRLELTQQVRDEDMARVRAVYDRLRSRPNSRRSLPICRRGWRPAISWSRAPAPARWPSSQRSAGPRSWCRCPGRSTRTSSPMPACWRRSDGALRIPQGEFTPDRLAAEISALAAEPARLTAMASAARKVGRLDAAERLADLVMKVAGI